MAETDNNKVELIPNMPKTPEGQKALEAALDARNYADYECYQILKEIMDQPGPSSSFRLTAAWVNQALVAIKKREDNNELFMRLMSGN